MKKTCFVIIGFGTKTDFETGRTINLDKTFESIIKPVFEDLDIFCFRSCDLPQSGVIDVKMYESIFKADFVVADISTLNANALYELGVRHALRPNTTIVIAENKVNIPFDVNHILVHFYEHLESDIGYSEVVRFQKHLKTQVESFLSKPETDSPIYTFLPNLKPPNFSENEIEKIEETVKSESHSVSDLLDLAERKTKAREFQFAKDLFKEAIKSKPNDSFIIQRFALTTYKSKQPSEEEALKEALKILESLNPKTTTDPETLGLLGAINKRLYENKENLSFLNEAIHFYERGYYVKQDYYNGINVAFLYTLKASLSKDKFDKYANYGQAKKIWKELLNKWSKIVEAPEFVNRGDKEWIYVTLAEACFGLGDLAKEQNYLNLAKTIPNTDFAIDTYNEQKNKIQNAMDTLDIIE
ncbi:TRAFs-binding domain-containing protein [Algibacter sp. AS12]|uniref:TRAFs-binding domain-containing protein n=1 Tax=Algibacter sp. AS12 TaxID=3135773 RepID=UPI00398B505C